MSDYPMLISNKLHSFRNFGQQIYKILRYVRNVVIVYLLRFCRFCCVGVYIFLFEVSFINHNGYFV